MDFKYYLRKKFQLAIEKELEKYNPFSVSSTTFGHRPHVVPGTFFIVSLI